MLRVVKIGGSALEEAAWLERLARVAATSTCELVVVHGGGPEVSRLSDRLGIGVSWVEGRRVTTPETLDVVAMVLSGRINQRVVSTFLAAGVDAVGLSGVDGSLLQAEPLAGGALGRVGRVRSVRASLLRALLAEGHVPVVSPISRAPDGGALNVNADDAATAIAAALGADELLYVTNVEGVLGAEGRLAELNAADAAALVAAGVASGGMAVKIEAALTGVAAGVPVVRIGGAEMLVDHGAGTRIHGTEVAA